MEPLSCKYRKHVSFQPSLKCHCSYTPDTTNNRVKFVLLRKIPLVCFSASSLRAFCFAHVFLWHLSSVSRHSHLANKHLQLQSVGCGAELLQYIFTRQEQDHGTFCFIVSKIGTEWGQFQPEFQRQKTTEHTVFILKTLTESPNATHFVRYYRCFFRVYIWTFGDIQFLECIQALTDGEVVFLEEIADVAYLRNSFAFPL